MKNNGFNKIVIPKFTFPDGTVDLFSGYLRSWESTDEKNVEHLRFFDDNTNYYVILIDKSPTRKSKNPTFVIDNKFYHYKIKSCGTIGCNVNPDNGHLLVPHECDDSSCKAKIILYGKVGS